MNTSEPKADTIAQLIEKFEDSILLNGDGRVDVRYYRSEWRKKLVDSAPFILARIAEHLEAVKDRKDYHYFNSEVELRAAWYMFLKEISEVHHLGLYPEIGSDFHGLSLWAKTHAA